MRGRIYYNLVSWYRVLAMLPGFAVNRRFMEQMMGVREPMPDEVLARRAAAHARGRAVDGLRLARSIGGLAWALVRLPSQIDRFYTRLNTALGAPTPLADMRLDELTAHYRSLERQLLTRWDAPLVNDFFAMIFYGVLRSLCTRWAGDVDGTLQNDSGHRRGRHRQRGAGASRERAGPARGIPPHAAHGAGHRVARRHPGGDGRSCRTRRSPASTTRTWTKFSDRCLDELKLESPTLADDPLMLLRTIGRLALRRREAATGHRPRCRAGAGATTASPRRSARAGRGARRGPRCTGIRCAG